MGEKIIPRIRLTSAKVLVEVEAELANSIFVEKSLFQPPWVHENRLLDLKSDQFIDSSR